MKLIASHPRKTAFCLLLVMLVQLVAPTVTYALTSGPTQPETKGFEPIGNSDMVDLFTGDFTYNVPVMDVGGYPVNLAYHSGASLDDEASWVGYGWSLNVGSVNRQMRGLPDDFNGTDKQEREMSMKDHVTTGGKFSVSLDLLGIPVGKVNKKKKKKKLNLLNPTVSVGLKYDNYRGIGMEIGANAGVSLTTYAAGDKTTGSSDSATSNLSFGKVGMTLSSFDGASLSINPSILSKSLSLGDKAAISKSIGFGYNTRAGLTGMTLEHAFSFKRKDNSWGKHSNSSFISFNAESYTPTIDHPRKSNSFTFSLSGGAELWFAYLGLGATGFYSQQSVAESKRQLPSYGYLYAEKGAGDPYALMDVNREKDIPYSKDVKYLPIPVPGYDLFSASSQDGGGQYRAFRGSSGVFFDPRTETNSKDYSAGVEVGGGFFLDVGADLYYQTIKTKSQKWADRNKALSAVDFQKASGNVYEPVYFKKVGESVPVDKAYLNRIKNTSPFAVNLTSRLANGVEGAEASDKIRTPLSKSENIPALKRNEREIRNTAFSYLTAKEADKGALEKTIKDHRPDSLALNNCSTGGIKSTIQRNSGYRKGHHISEITITGEDGKRSVFGIPVYNMYQEEVSFSIGADLSKRKKGLIDYVKGVDDTVYNRKGRDNYYSKEVTKPYATSYLLTSILSPDYVDKTGNGVTDDDIGTAVKFNYTKLDGLYKWRTPYSHSANQANYNEGFLSDNLDDKASYVYGEKEVWYLHSIESKTMVAHFILGDREDALGVTGDGGSVNTATRLKYLKEIRLYSKSDLQQNNNDPSKTTPVKVAHFVYNYSICKGLPNSTAGNGKLTLEKVYFTFGGNNKGKLSPYEFSYDTTYNHYDYRQYDRWGVFKDADLNPNGLNNSEFPYTLQDTALANKFVSAGQLNKIVLPSGGVINISYESDDYAYVQDKRAAQMCFVKGVNAAGDSTGLVNADFIYVDLPVPVAPSELKEAYFENMDKLYFKFLLDLDGLGHKEFVPGYAQIESVSAGELDGSGKVKSARIKLQKVDGKNPISKAGWQFVRMNLPKYAYPNSENIESNESDIKKTIKALVAAFGSIKELFQGFEKRAEKKGYANRFDKGRSWVRLCSPNKRKLGGGSRVRRIDMSDDWAAMSGATSAKTATYSQVFDYTTKDAKGRTISSGVASYEPMLGNDENLFRQPVNYKQKQFLGLDNYFYIEEPFCESFFPGASVGYSKVSVKGIGAGDDESVNRTGLTVSEFYTAKDYPVKVNIMGLDQKKPASNKIFKLIGGISYDVIGLSQGYSIELNDMHGKPRSVNIYNKSGQNISKVEYYYKTVNDLAEKKELSNNVTVMDNLGYTSEGQVGMEVETYTDMRQQTTDNLGISAKVSGGSGSILIFPLPFFFPGIGVNYDRRSYRASSTIKIINRYAIQHKVMKMQNGSSITTENILWDAATGNVLLTKTQNEFDDPIYSFSYPAHWMYPGMAQAYLNLGTVITGFSTGSNGETSQNGYILFPGDELLNLESGEKYWVAASSAGWGIQNRIIDAEGNVRQLSNASVKVLRSGRRNLSGISVGSIVSLKNPVAGGVLDITALTKVLDAKAALFSEEWSMPVYGCETCPEGYTVSDDGNFCVSTVEADSDNSCYTICEGDHVPSNYSASGTVIYNPGYDHTGQGSWDTLMQANPFWRGPDCPPPPAGSIAPEPVVLPARSREDSLKKGVMKQGRQMPAPGQSVPQELPCQLTPTPRTNFCGPLNRTSIWTCQGTVNGNRMPIDQWIGFSRCINVPETKVYYLGIGSDNDFRITVDGVQILESVTGDGYNFNLWHIYPVTLTAGTHVINMEARNTDSEGAFGAEIYNNTMQQIASATSYANLSLLFTTRDMIGQQFNIGPHSCPQGYSLNACDSTLSCQAVIPRQNNKKLNPYVAGMLGNWRPKAQYAYQVNRENIPGNSQPGSTNIRKSGAYSVFNPFWVNEMDWSGAWRPVTPQEDERWIAAAEATHFNTKGMEIETRNALNQYSSALFGYLESLPVAVASNTRYRELAYDGFEDYNFSLDCNAQDTCSYRSHFSFRNLLGGSASLTGQYAHSGKSSLSLNGTVSMTRSVYNGDPQSRFTYNNRGEFLLADNELAKGFSPLPGRKYVLSFWVRDNAPRDPSTTVQASINGNALLGGLSKWPVVEGWKRVEVPFVLSSLAQNFTLQLSSGGQAYIDDIRIYPYDGQMKSFAYDASSQRLMAEMDENNFATFYEYDDEGILVRVKKETERGIMTIKETRSAYRKR